MRIPIVRVCLLAWLIIGLSVPLVAQEKRSSDGDDKNQVKASFTVNDNKHELKHAVAFDGYYFDDKVPYVFLTERAVDVDGLRKAASEDFDAFNMFVIRQRGAYLLVRVTADDDVSVSGWANNLSLGGVAELKFDCESKDGRIKSKLKTEKTVEIGPYKYSLEAEFDVEKIDQ